LDGRTLGSGISPTVAWEKALAKMISERAIDHVNGIAYDNQLSNLRVVKLSENLRGQA
jgi:HNH endonuclease